MANTLYKILNRRVQQLETKIFQEENKFDHLTMKGESAQALEASYQKISLLKNKKADLEIRIFYMQKFESQLPWGKSLSNIA